MSTRERIGLSVAVVLLFTVLRWLSLTTIAETIQILIMFALMMITWVYVERTADIAKAAREQAEASVKMAEEMRAQTVAASRPWIILRAECETLSSLYLTKSEYFSHFEVYNAGTGPAIEVEVSLLNKQETPLVPYRETFLRAGEQPLQFRLPFNVALLEETTYNLVCEYRGILSAHAQTWYQTWLPFEPVKSSNPDKIYVKPGELRFEEVNQAKRIDAFGSRSKPQ